MGSSSLLPPAGQPATGPDAKFTTGAFSSQVTFGFSNITPPSPLYIQRDDLLAVQVVSFIPGGVEGVTVNLRLLLPTGPRPGQPDSPQVVATEEPGITNQTIQNTQFVVPLAVGTKLFNLSEGYLLSISAVAAAATQRGQTFVRVWVQRGSSIFNVAQASLPLFSDYVTIVQPAGWPFGRLIHPQEGPGCLVAASVGNPAAGADWVYTQPAFTRARIIGTSATFTAAAAVANRQTQLVIDTGAPPDLVTGIPNQVVVANAVVKVSGTTAPVSASANVPDVSVGLPAETIIGQGSRVRSNTVNIQAADQWSNIRLFLEQWIDQA